MVTAKKPPRAEACGSVEAGSMICDLRSDHSFDHLQVRTTWEIWTLRHEKARVSDEKARKSTQNEAKKRCRAVWDQDVAGSNPVIPTQIADLTAFCGQIGVNLIRHRRLCTVMPD